MVAPEIPSYMRDLYGDSSFCPPEDAVGMECFFRDHPDSRFILAYFLIVLLCPAVSPGRDNDNVRASQLLLASKLVWGSRMALCLPWWQNCVLDSMRTQTMSSEALIPVGTTRVIICIHGLCTIVGLSILVRVNRLPWMPLSCVDWRPCFPPSSKNLSGVSLRLVLLFRTVIPSEFVTILCSPGSTTTPAFATLRGDVP